MSDYPEHDKLAEVSEQTQAIGEFLDWLGSQGVNLMVWREDLTDNRPTDTDCPKRQRDRQQGLPCQPTADDATKAEYYFRAHCMHWNDPQREAGSAARSGTCCYCGKGQHYEVTGLRSWIHEARGTTQLLADWAGIDQNKIEAEKRRMLAACRAMNEKA